MKQKVHSVSYLAKAEFEFKSGVYDLVALPTGAEVVKVGLEVVGNPEAGSISVGFKDENIRDYFLTVANTELKSRSFLSLSDYTATSNTVVAARVEGTSLSGVKCVLRVLYFLPSVIEVEY
ncbi:hypothetical protein KVE53_03130 [Helicobacter pylori]|nr:hypothetical protein KVE53_03130 [Helicobacter pylori]